MTEIKRLRECMSEVCPRCKLKYDASLVGTGSFLHWRHSDGTPCVAGSYRTKLMEMIDGRAEERDDKVLAHPHQGKVRY